MRKAYKFKLQNQSNTIKIGNMIDDMWEIHVHILLLARRYYRMYCAYHNKELSLSDRQWTCPDCGSHHDRDRNAALNIKRAGLAA